MVLVLLLLFLYNVCLASTARTSDSILAAQRHNMPAPVKPTILFVPGAWLRCAAYKSFLDVLDKAGYPTRCAEYPSLNPADPLTADIATDANSIRDTFLLPLIEKQKKDVVIVMHSYGGLPGSVAAKGLGEVSRASQGKNGVVGLIFISGFVLPEGASVADGQGGALPPWVQENDPRAGLTMPLDPIKILAADVEASLAQANAAHLLPHATLAFKSPSPPAAWSDPAFRGRLAYIVCTEDQAIPKAGQEAMMQLTGQSWIVQELQGSHNAPFWLKEQEAARMVDTIVDTFRREANGGVTATS